MEKLTVENVSFVGSVFVELKPVKIAIFRSKVALEKLLLFPLLKQKVIKK